MKTAAPVTTLTACLLLTAPSLFPNRADAQARGREGTKQNDPPRSEPRRNDPPPSAPPASSPPPRREDPPAPVYVAPTRPPSNTNTPPGNAPRVRSDNGARPNITNPPARNREEQRQSESPNKSNRPGGAGRPVFGPNPYWGVPTFAQPIWQPPYFTPYNNGRNGSLSSGYSWNSPAWNGPAWAQPVYVQPYILEPLGPQPIWLDPIVVTRNSPASSPQSSGSDPRFRFDDTRWQKNWGTLDEHPAWFPDGRRLVFSSLRENNRDLYLIDLSSPGNPPTRLTQSPADDYAPVVSPNGQAIAYISERDGRPALYLLKLETRELICLVRPAGRGIGAPSFSPDGRWIAFENRFDTSSVLFRVAADGSGVIERLGSFEGTGI